MSLNKLLIVVGLAATLSTTVSAQRFDFDRLSRAAENYTVILDIQIELSFGVQSTEQQERVLGTVVRDDGLVLFDGSFLDAGSEFGFAGGLTVRTTPTSITVTTLEGTELAAEYVGMDRTSRLGFARILESNDEFVPVRFTRTQRFTIGSWVAIYTLLPDYVVPPIAADIGMISALLSEPEPFPLIVGFSPIQVGGVLYDERMNAVGVLGNLPEPIAGSIDPAGFGAGPSFPLLGIVQGDRLQRLVDDPPMRGEVDRGWLGITLQALTPDIANFLQLPVESGIIVNDVVAGSPADQAGLQTGDVIYAIDGFPVPVDREERLPVFQRRISEMGPGADVSFDVYRTSQDTLTAVVVDATLADAPMSASDAPEYENSLLEFTVRELVFADFMANNLDRDTFAGAVVSKLESGGPAFVGGLRIGDVIQRIGTEDIASIGDAETVLESDRLREADEVIFFVWRAGRTLFVNVKVT